MLSITFPTSDKYHYLLEKSIFKKILMTAYIKIYVSS